MKPVLTWVDLTVGDRERMRQALQLFGETGTVDEMGLGRIRDALADELFPGASIIQTRLRYVLFIPWIYRQLEAQRITPAQVAQTARARELELVAPLGLNDDSRGIFGSSAKGALATLPSAVYWVGLSQWGIFMHPGRTLAWYHENILRLARGTESTGHADDAGVIYAGQPNWHPQLPAPPDSFPEKASFALTREEAEFLQGRLRERCPGSMLAWLASEGTTACAEALWDDPDARRAPGRLADVLELARRFSLHVQGLPLLYNLMLAEKRAKIYGASDHEPHDPDGYQKLLAEWAEQEQQEAPLDLQNLWKFLAERGVPFVASRSFLTHWTERTRQVSPYGVADDADLRRLVEQRERTLKKTRARLVNNERLRDWNGCSGIKRMNFRWTIVRQLLHDLHTGLSA